MQAAPSRTGNSGLSTTGRALFRTRLLEWFGRQQRDLPWRRTRDPYAIWVSEIMLQQTRVAAVIPFYERFLERFPNAAALAEAPETDLLACWAGLGYYHRARNLQKAARAIAARGGFPSTHEEIRALPGIGEYTSAAVASIGFELPHAAVDGNVLRVLSRVLNDSRDIAAGAGRKFFAGAAEELLDRAMPGAFNQAMMELGATLCLPKNPQCLLCPVAELCRARAAGTQNELPVKGKSRRTVTERRVLLWMERGGAVLLWQRPPEARLMAGFWELPEAEQLPQARAGSALGAFRHGITFHDYRFEIQELLESGPPGSCLWVDVAALERLPLSTIARKALRILGRGEQKAAESAGTHGRQETRQSS